jgi:transposase
MKAKQQGEKKARKQYSAEFKEQALKRAEKDGVAAAARDLGLAESQIYG